jgi:energy-coupling factor transporter ATP-binding protein EcfA2
MPTFNIVRESKIAASFRVAQIRGMYDYSRESVRHEWTSVLPLEEKSWGIGLIVGPSGCGKTTLAQTAFESFYFHQQFEWHKSNSFVDDFDESCDIKTIVSTLNAVGFSSPPHWFKPYAHLSNGQKFRVELARCLLSNTSGVVFDEFTSVVDRDVAKIGCAAVSKYLRKKASPPFVAVSCHYDIIDWLDPDWVFDVGSQRFEWRERRRFPEIVLDVRKTTSAAWNIFREHHYLDHALNKTAQCFVATWNNKPVAFCSVLHFPHAVCANFKREHRTVVLPDFQGIGIGNRLSEYVAEYFLRKGFRFISTTSAPAMIRHRAKSLRWKMTRLGKTVKNVRMKTSHKRITASFEFIR